MEEKVGRERCMHGENVMDIVREGEMRRKGRSEGGEWIEEGGREGGL